MPLLCSQNDLKLLFLAAVQRCFKYKKSQIVPRDIVGRRREKEKLEEALKSDRSELIAVYGRRRIGKTHLIREFYAKQFAFTFSG